MSPIVEVQKVQIDIIVPMIDDADRLLARIHYKNIKD